MATLSMEVPDELLSRAESAVEVVLRNHRWDLEKQARVKAILETDEAFAEAYGRYPIVRASVYAGQKISYEREQLRACGSDERRPVAMRAAGLIIADSWYADKLLMRFLRRKRFTCVKREQLFDLICPIEHKIESKIWRLAQSRKRIHFEWRIHLGYERDCSAWVDGNFYTDLSEQQMSALQQAAALLPENREPLKRLKSVKDTKAKALELP